MENTKKTFFNLLFILTISLTFFNCREIKQDDAPKDKHVEAPEEIIEISEARLQYNTYEKRRVGLIQKFEDSVDGYYNDDKIRQEQNSQEAQVDPNDPNGARFDVARYVYWDYDTMKNYLKYIDQEAKKAKVDISTLRFYFSNYPEDDTSAVHPRQNSIIITPTLHKGDREYIFSIDDRDAENIKPILLSDSFGPAKSEGMGDANGQDQRSYASFAPNAIKTNSNLVVPTIQPGTSLSMNKGGSAPPPHH